MQICLCDVNVAIDLPASRQIPAPATDQSCAATSSANTPIGVGCPHAAPWCANLHSARRSRRHRLQFPAGSFIEGFRTPATVQAASLRSAGIRNPQQKRKWRRLHATSALPPTTDISRVLRRRSAKHSADQNRRSVSRYHPSTLPPSWCSQGFDARLRLALASR